MRTEKVLGIEGLTIRGAGFSGPAPMPYLVAKSGHSVVNLDKLTYAEPGVRWRRPVPIRAPHRH